MVTPVQTEITTVSTAAILRENAIRRIITPELESALTNESLTDSLSIDLRGWYRDFMQALHIASRLEVGAIGYATDQYIGLLRDILKDPVTQAPFEDDVLLGSDGHSYSRMTIYRYTNGVPRTYRNRSPFNPNSEDVFTTTPHPIAGIVVRWLLMRDHNFAAHRAQIQQEVAASFDRTMRRRILEAQQQASEARRAAITTNLVTAGVQLSRDVIAARFNQIDRIDERARAAIEAEIARPDEEEARMTTDMFRSIEEMQEAIRQMQEQLPAMNESLMQTRTQIDNVDAKLKELNDQIQATADAIKKAKKNILGDLLKGLVVIGVCCFAGWGLTQLATKLGWGAATGTATVSGGVASGGFKLAIPPVF